ncbi:MAG: glycosyltransferase family 2 protein [Gammaproteobacteria bacterium]|nr:glycosyltransferase family 2 protein [Gammaproteobacteria bacterium]
MNKIPTVSIGLPVFNGATYLPEALESLLAQRYESFELLISDNASSDETQSICESFARRDARIKYLRQAENLGAAKNYNLLVDAAKGRYFKWAAHDDLCKPEYLKACVAILEQNPDVILAYSQTEIIDGEGQHMHYFDDGLHLMSDSVVARYQQFHERFRSPGECNAVFGVMRIDELRETARIGNYPASDKVLLAELALRGKFYEVEARMFLRRDHESTSLRANPDYAERAQWFDPTKREKIVMPTWRWWREYYAAITRSPIALMQRIACYHETNKWSLFARKELVNDIKKALKTLLIRSSVGGKLLQYYRNLRGVS